MRGCLLSNDLKEPVLSNLFFHFTLHEIYELAKKIYMQGICKQMDISPWFWHYLFQNLHYCLLTSLTIIMQATNIFLHQLLKRDYHFKHIENLRVVNTYVFTYYFPPICSGIWWVTPLHSFQILWRSCRHDTKVSIPPLIVGHR